MSGNNMPPEPPPPESADRPNGRRLQREIAVKPDVAVNMLGIIAQAASDSRVDVVKMTALLELQEKLLAREAEGEFNRALAKMNTEDLRVTKNGEVSLTRGGSVSYKFATWEDMDKLIRPLMRQHGFTLSFDTAPGPNGGLVVIGELLHEGGHRRTARIPLAMDTGPGRNALQAMGSTVSYGKRYVTEMLLNIVRENEDDDGQAGAPSQPQRQNYADTRQQAQRAPSRPASSEAFRSAGLPPKMPPATNGHLDEPLVTADGEVVEWLVGAWLPAAIAKLGTTPDQVEWLAVLERVLSEAPDGDSITAIKATEGVQVALRKAPLKVRKQINDWVEVAQKRIAAAAFPDAPSDEAVEATS